MTYHDLCVSAQNFQMLYPGKELKQKLGTDELVIGLMATDHVWPFLKNTL